MQVVRPVVRRELVFGPVQGEARAADPVPVPTDDGPEIGGLTEIALKVVVPEEYYDLILRRLEELDTRIDQERRTLHRFLAHRCDGSFLQRYLATHPDFIRKLPIWSYLTVISETPIFIRLHECGLLPEQQRTRLVTRVQELAVETPDAGVFEDQGLRYILNTEELEETLRKVRSDLLPGLNDVIRNWEFNYRGPEERPEDYFSSLIDTLRTYRSVFMAEPEAIQQIDKALDRIKDVIADLEEEEEPPREGDDNSYDRGPTISSVASGRSVFDDVDG